MVDVDEYGPHPSFREPSNERVQIWRYMDLAKYLAILQQRSLFFPRATLLGDPFEGYSTKPMVAARQDTMMYDPALAEYRVMPDPDADNIGKIVRKWAEEYLVCCWHMNEHESAAMWKLYMRSNEGVCIQSTYRRLRSCLPRCVLIGEVNYIDYHTQRFSMGYTFNFIMHKRKSFEHERELRAVFWEKDNRSDAHPYKTRIEPAGLSIEVDLPSLIETVRISPAAEPWLAKVIEEATEKYDLHVPVLQSASSESPLY